MFDFLKRTSRYLLHVLEFHIFQSYSLLFIINFLNSAINSPSCTRSQSFSLVEAVFINISLRFLALNNYNLHVLAPLNIVLHRYFLIYITRAHHHISTRIDLSLVYFFLFEVYFFEYLASFSRNLFIRIYNYITFIYLSKKKKKKKDQKTARYIILVRFERGSRAKTPKASRSISLGVSSFRRVSSIVVIKYF